MDFNDTLTPNDTVIYDLDNIVRNDGSEVPINLNDDSYGFVAISAVSCLTNEDVLDSMIGNFRIIDNAGYEYRMNLINDDGSDSNLVLPSISGSPATANVIIPFNTVDGANQADIVGFIVADDRDSLGNSEIRDIVYNEPVGITFSVFLIDENEERLSCDQKTIGCGPEVTLNYGINDDYPNSKGGPLLCEGGGLLPDQKHGYISLENASFLSTLDQLGLTNGPPFEFKCLVGLNNGNGTGSMDKCQYKCNFGNDVVTTGGNTPF